MNPRTEKEATVSTVFIRTPQFPCNCPKGETTFHISLHLNTQLWFSAPLSFLSLRSLRYYWVQRIRKRVQKKHKNVLPPDSNTVSSLWISICKKCQKEGWRHAEDSWVLCCFCTAFQSLNKGIQIYFFVVVCFCFFEGGCKMMHIQKGLLSQPSSQHVVLQRHPPCRRHAYKRDLNFNFKPP